MSTVNYINISLEIFGALLSLIILFFLLQTDRKKSYQDKLFAGLLISNAVVQLSDAASWFFNGRPDILGGSIVYIANFLAYISGYVLMGIFGEYIISFLAAANKKVTRSYSHAIWIFTGIGILLTVVSQFNGMFYIIDAQNVYQRKSLFWLSQVLGIMGAAICTVGLFVCRKNLGKSERQLLISFVTIGPLALIGQMFSYGITFLYLATTISSIFIYVFLQTEQSRRLSENELELERSRTAIMLSQIQPHFIYNTLATIKSLCPHDAKDARTTIERFSKYLRGNMDSLTETLPIPFEDELAHTKCYLEIEQLRFGKRLSVNYEIQTQDFNIPALSLQPLAENAVCHGILMRNSGGTLSIASYETEESYIITVSDDGVGFDMALTPNDGKTHIGVNNVRSRLKVQVNGSLTFDSVVGKGTTATITIPKGGKGSESNRS